MNSAVQVRAHGIDGRGECRHSAVVTGSDVARLLDGAGQLLFTYTDTAIGGCTLSVRAVSQLPSWLPPLLFAQLCRNDDGSFSWLAVPWPWKLRGLFWLKSMLELSNDRSKGER